MRFAFHDPMRRLALVLALRAAAAIAQQQPEAILRDAIAHHQAGDIHDAIRLYREYLKAGPESVLILSNLGAALAHEGRYSEAIAEYNRALKMEPGNSGALLNLALAYYKTGRFAEARDKLMIVWPLMPRNRQVSFLLANCHVQMGDYKKAVELLDPWEKETPDDLTLNYLLGTALIRDHQTARGSQVIDRILRNGDSAEARLLLGTTQLNAKDFAGAREDLKKAIELNPGLPDAQSYLGLALLGMMDTDGAEAAFRAELERNPTNYIAALQLGVLAIQDRRYDEARSLF